VVKRAKSNEAPPLTRNPGGKTPEQRRVEYTEALRSAPPWPSYAQAPLHRRSMEHGKAIRRMRAYVRSRGKVLGVLEGLR
jgi:hypothetical protein